jgi:signal transduction histidine kinase/CheY-like chemotaxis protein
VARLGRFRSMWMFAKRRRVWWSLQATHRVFRASPNSRLSLVRPVYFPHADAGESLAVVASQRFRTFQLWLFPMPPDVDEARHRFPTLALMLAVLMALIGAPVFAMANPIAAVVIALFGVASILLAWTVRLTRNAAIGFWGLNVVSAALFVVGSWTEADSRIAWAMWLALLPLTAMLHGGFFPGLAALALALGSGMVIVLVPVPAGFVPDASTPASNLTKVLAFFVTAFTAGALWQSMRLKALEKAEAGARARTLFLANMSHELRTPMNGVIGLTELLLTANPRTDQLEMLNVMRRSGLQLLSLINDIIDFTRLDAGRMPLERVPLDLPRVFSDTVDLLRPAAKGVGPTLELVMAPDLPRYITGDEVRLRQVLANLLGNAVKFTPSGSVTLDARRADDRLLIAVKDTGVGIAPEVQARLFKPFEQAEAGSSRRHGGSGLGLAIARELVELMGGTVTLESALGQGSTFTVSLPLLEAVAPWQEESASAPKPALPDRTVLVVDDNQVNLFVAVSLLKKAGYRTATAKSGLEAVSQVSSQEFDAILMDCHMPELDGYEATRRIRKLDAPRNAVPIIALTASALPEELEHCLTVGMDAYLTKPVTIGALTTTLETILASRAARPSEMAARRALAASRLEDGAPPAAERVLSSPSGDTEATRAKRSA